MARVATHLHKCIVNTDTCTYRYCRHTGTCTSTLHNRHVCTCTSALWTQILVPVGTVDTQVHYTSTCISALWTQTLGCTCRYSRRADTCTNISDTGTCTDDDVWVIDHFTEQSFYWVQKLNLLRKQINHFTERSFYRISTVGGVVRVRHHGFWRNSLWRFPGYLYDDGVRQHHRCQIRTIQDRSFQTRV